MSKKKIISIHFFIWLFAICANLPFASLGRNIPPDRLVSYIVAFLYLMAIFYLFYMAIVPLLLEKKNMRSFFLVSFFIVLIMPYFGYTNLFFIRALYEHNFHDFYRGYSLKMHMSGYFPVLTAALFGSFFRIIITWFSTMNQKAELDKQKLAMELEMIRNKMNPHFLFNTLNNIDSLIQTDQAEASAMLIRLSDIMRYMTYDTGSDLVDMSREADYLRNLIELNRLRINNPDEIFFEVSGDMRVKIAPALFAPLIENAFKFASFRNHKPSIEIRLTSSEGIVTFCASNYFENASSVADKEYSGSGILNLRRRLDLTYQDRYRMEINNKEPLFSVKLTIDTNADTLHSN
jgi:two-component system, LytTR family, sensor kinase